MNRFAAAVILVAGITLPVAWFWQGKAMPAVAQSKAPRDRPVAEKLNTIIIPTYPTEKVTLAEAVEFLRIQSREHDTAAPEPWDRGVNIVIITGSERRLPASSSLSLRDVPLGEALRHVTELVDLKYTIEPHAVAIREPQDMRTPSSQIASALEQRLAKRIRPTVSFGGATLAEAVEYLRVSQGCIDAADEQVMDIPLNFVLHLRAGIKRPSISLDLRDIPMSEALRYCAEISNAGLRYDTAAVMITDIETETSPLNAPTASPILRTVDFQDATLAEALDFVRIKSRELNPDQRETSITVKPGAASQAITLSLKSISIHETLRYIAELSGHQLSLEGGSYVLRPL
ncbi:hypothetical protein [Prosthecobacter sp.]|uniref:hypothetical protein n=1 Tax=Prosthecobacter sp. TaxID=1965333 RepID=UPI003783797B